jgi:hypothetical protein
MDSTVIIGDEGVGRFVPEPRFDSFIGLARHLASIGIAGLFTGVAVGGVGGRIFMRIAGAAASDRVQGFGTEAGFRVGEVTFGGSLVLVIFIGMFTGVAGAVLYGVFSPWISWAQRWRGLLFGVILFGAASAISDVMNPDNVDFFILGNSVLLVVLIGILFVTFGIVMASSVAFLEQRLPAGESRSNANKVEYLAVAAIGLFAFAIVVPLFFTEDACSCTPPLAASWSVVATGVGTVILWSTAVFSSVPTWLRRVAVMFGYTGLVGVVVFGLLRAVTDAFEIIG